MIFKLLNRYWLDGIMGSVVSITMISIIGLLPLTAQAQFPDEPADFDRLLVGEIIPHGQAVATSNCRGGASSEPCSGVLNVRFGNVEINTTSIGTTTSSTLVVKIRARAGQAAVGELAIPASCTNAAGEDVPGGTFSAGACIGVGGAGSVYVAAEPGNLAQDMPANVMYIVATQLTYNNVSLFTEAAPPCVGSIEEHPTSVFTGFSPADSLRGFGIEGYSYGSSSIARGTLPADLTADIVIQWKPDEYLEYVTVTCDLPTGYETELLDMAIQIRGVLGLTGHQIGPNTRSDYAIRAENSLEFFPLDETNYITHAEITEDGQGVLIEYAQAITSPTGTYAITALDGSVITPTISDTIWLNDKTVWLGLATSIYTGVNVAATALDSDRHVFVTATYPDDISFGTNFAQVSTYRATLTRHASEADLNRTAPRVTELDNDYDSIELTFSDAVCGSPETGCAALTADHFEVVHYVGDVSSAELATLLTISTVTLTGDSTNGYTVAVLDIDLDSAPEIDGDDYLLVRTARNSRFTDNFITDRTIFSATKVARTLPFETVPYSEAESGMLHLQSGALLEAIPVITYTVAGNSISEGGAERSTATFTITRAPDRVKFETAVGIAITRTSGDEPGNFSVAVGDEELTRSGDGIVWSGMVTFGPLENEKMIFVSFTGDDVGTGDSEYEIALTLPAGARSAVGSINTFTVEEDDNAAPVINLAVTTINETAVELDDGNQRDFDDITTYESRPVTQSSQLFSISDPSNPVVTDGPNSTTYTRVVCNVNR